MSRLRAGQSFIELTVGIVILVPILLVLFDFAVMLMGVEANDQICRTAARAAAAGPPADANKRALSVLASHGSTMNMVSNSTIAEPVKVQVSSQPQEEKDIAADKQTCPGGPIIGATTVTTEITIKPIIVHLFYGGKSSMTFKSTHTFPISYIMAAK